MFKVPVLKSETASGIPINLPLRPAVSGEDGRAMPKLGRDRRNDEGDGCCPLGSCDSNSTDTDADAAASPLVFFGTSFNWFPCHSHAASTGWQKGVMSIRKYLQKIRKLYIHWVNCVVVPAKNKTKIVAPDLVPHFLNQTQKRRLTKSNCCRRFGSPWSFVFFPGEFGRVAVALFPEVQRGILRHLAHYLKLGGPSSPSSQRYEKWPGQQATQGELPTKIKHVIEREIEIGRECKTM